MIIRIKSGNTNCYLLFRESTKKSVLIDAGVSSDHTFLERLQAKGYLSQIALVILTHGHYDHVGHAAMLQNRFHIPVAIHRNELERVTQGIMDFPPAKGFISNTFRKSTMSGMEKSTYQKFVPDIVLDGSRILSSFPEIEILHLPGHTKGSIGIIFEDSLFAGDLVMNMPVPSKSWFAEDFSELQQSIERISNLRLKRVYPSHGKSFSGQWINHLCPVHGSIKAQGLSCGNGSTENRR